MNKNLGMAMLATVVGLGLASTAFAGDATTEYSQDGISLKSGENTLKVASVFQTRLTVSDQHDGVNDFDGTAFGIRRFKTKFSGTLFNKDKWSYSATLAWNSESTGRMIETAYVGYKLNDSVKLAMGRTKLKFNLEEYTSSSRQTFADRSWTSERFNMDHGTGLFMMGSSAVGDGKVHYDFGLFNGNSRGTNGQNQDFGGNMRHDFMLNGRIGYSSDDGAVTKYSSDLRKDGDRGLVYYVGLGLNHQMLNNGEIPVLGTDDGSVNSAVLDARVHVDGFSLNASYFYRSISVDREDDTVGTGGTHASGFSVMAGYNMNLEGGDQLEFALKYNSYNDDDHGGVGGNDGAESGLAVNYRFNKDKLKATFDANYLETQGHGVANSNVVPSWTFRFQVQVKF